MKEIEVTVQVGQHQKTFRECEFKEPGIARVASDPIESCKDAIKFSKQSYYYYQRGHGSVEGSLRYVARIHIMEALLNELTAKPQKERTITMKRYKLTIQHMKSLEYGREHIEVRYTYATNKTEARKLIWTRDDIQCQWRILSVEEVD